MIGIVTVASAVGIAPSGTARIPARYRPMDPPPARDLDAPAGEANGPRFCAATPCRLERLGCGW
jgi:hypothetical protein